MKEKKILLVVAGVLAVISLISVQWEVLSNRWLRLLTSGIFFLLAFRVISLKKFWGLLILGQLMLCDFLLLEWETRLAKHAYYSLHSLIMLSLAFLTIKEMKWRKISFFEIASAILFLSINSYIFLTLREYFSIENILLKTLFSVNGFLIVFVVVLAFFYSINRPNPITAFFFLGVLGLVVSELMVFSIYFLDIETFLYIDNIFYVIGLFFLLRAALQDKFLEETKMNPVEEEERKESDCEQVNIYR